MPYLNLDLNYCEHPKTRRLVALIGPEADIYPIRLWSYCGKIHAKDGAMKGYSRAEVEAVLGWKGRKGALIAALVKVGFITAKGGFSCVDWEQHQGHLEAFSRRGTDANKRRWEMVRQGLPVGVQKRKIGNPPTEPSLPSYLPTIPTEPTTGDGSVDLGEQFKTAVKDLADKKARAAKEDRLMSLKWSVSGDHNGKRVQDLPSDYCEWAAANLRSIGQEYKDALAVRLEQKRSEAIK